MPSGQVRRRNARVLLAAIRLANGTLGLVAPELLIGRIERGRPPSASAIYAFRLFGVRTIFLGAELLVRRDAELQRALRQGVVIHASDVATSTLLGARHRTSPRTSAMLAAISTVNVVLAVAALEPSR